MASMPYIPVHEPAPPSKREGEREADERTAEVARRAGEARQAHKARVRASLDWALDEYASTLAKLAK
jgi:hypothetical protein